MTAPATAIPIVGHVPLPTRRRGGEAMAMAIPTRSWTVEEVQALPDDGNRYEVIDGELFVTPAPAWRHQDAVGALYLILAPYCTSLGTAHAYVSPADVHCGPRTLVQPDLFVVPLIEGRKPLRWEEAGRLLLAVEILSPTTARADRNVKRRLYQREGVPDYWIVDIEEPRRALAPGRRSS